MQLIFAPGSIRAGLAFQVKELYGISEIVKREEYIEARLRKDLPNHPNLVVLGPPTELITARMPIISFVIKCGKRFLHHNFVSVVLNDVYGIQTRSGCMCAGPYASRLFGIPTGVIDELESQIHDMQYLKPGFIRLSLVYFNSNEALDFIIASLLEVAEHAWKLLPQYRFDSATSNWVHIRNKEKNSTLVLPAFSLQSKSAVDMETGRISENKTEVMPCDANVVSHAGEYYDSVLSQSKLLYQSCHALYKNEANSSAGFLYDESHVPDYEAELYSGDRSKYAWFVYPREVIQSARAAALESDWVWAPPENEEGAGSFIKPELYWPSVCQR